MEPTLVYGPLDVQPDGDPPDEGVRRVRLQRRSRPLLRPAPAARLAVKPDVEALAPPPHANASASSDDDTSMLSVGSENDSFLRSDAESTMNDSVSTAQTSVDGADTTFLEDGDPSFDKVCVGKAVKGEMYFAKLLTNTRAKQDIITSASVQTMRLNRAPVLDDVFSPTPCVHIPTMLPVWGAGVPRNRPPLPPPRTHIPSVLPVRPPPIAQCDAPTFIFLNDPAIRGTPPARRPRADSFYLPAGRLAALAAPRPRLRRAPGKTSIELEPSKGGLPAIVLDPADGPSVPQPLPHAHHQSLARAQSHAHYHSLPRAPSHAHHQSLPLPNVGNAVLFARPGHVRKHHSTLRGGTCPGRLGAGTNLTPLREVDEFGMLFAPEVAVRAGAWRTAPTRSRVVQPQGLRRAPAQGSRRVSLEFEDELTVMYLAARSAKLAREREEKWQREEREREERERKAKVEVGRAKRQSAGEMMMGMWKKVRRMGIIGV